MERSASAFGGSANAHTRKYMTTRRVLLLVCAISMLMGLLVTNAPSHTQDRNCEDFVSQTAAQDHRDVHLGDPDGLDPDFDGIACEDELPCPCGSSVLPPAPPDHSRTQPPRSAPLSPARLAASVTSRARVVSVVDGSTLKVRRPAGEMVDVRLIGIDTPDRRGPAVRDDCGARGATARMKQLALRNGVGRMVKLRTDPTQDSEDRSGRLLAYVDGSGVDFGRTMISSGWGRVDVVKWDFLRVTAYREAEASAQAAKRGVWRRCGDSPTM